MTKGRFDKGSLRQENLTTILRSHNKDGAPHPNRKE